MESAVFHLTCHWHNGWICFFGSGHMTLWVPHWVCVCAYLCCSTSWSLAIFRIAYLHALEQVYGIRNWVWRMEVPILSMQNSAWVECPDVVLHFGKYGSMQTNVEELFAIYNELMLKTTATKKISLWSKSLLVKPWLPQHMYTFARMRNLHIFILISKDINFLFHVNSSKINCPNRFLGAKSG